MASGGGAATTTALDELGVSTAASSISKLNDDLLLLIFMTNVRIESNVPLYVLVDIMKRPLTTARLSSQVCRSWRHLLLNSPSIWGRLIQLDVLDQLSSHWRDEVLRRTRSSPLWVSGNVTGTCENPTPVRLYFYSLLYNRSCWERIERLNIIVHGSKMSDPAWDTFLLPAPNLQLFEVYFPHIDEPLFLGTFLPDSTKRLFGNHAPLLREFHGDGVDFSVDSAWLANLYDIAVPTRLTVPEILELLQHMPLLESFFIPTSDATENWVPTGLFSRIELPTLTVLLLSNTLPTCSTLLEHIYPATSCSLSLTTNVYYNPSLITKSVLRALREHLPRFIHNYFSTHDTERLKMRFHDDLFHFEDESPRYVHHIFFNVCVRTKPGSGSLPAESIHDLSELMFQIFVKCASDAPSHFSSVTGLSLDMHHLDTPPLKYVYSLLSAFPALQRLRTSEDSLVFLLALEDLRKDNSRAAKSSILFPSLRVLQLTYLDPDLCTLPGHSPGSLFPFLKGRVEANRPIDVLDLKLCGPDTLRDIHFVDEMKGLEVQWTEDDTECSYICSSGMPDMLNFGTRFGWRFHARN